MTDVTSVLSQIAEELQNALQNIDLTNLSLVSSTVTNVINSFASQNQLYTISSQSLGGKIGIGDVLSVSAAIRA